MMLGHRSVLGALCTNHGIPLTRTTTQFLCYQLRC